MKTISNWILIGVIEVIFCFWLLGTAASLVTSASNLKVGLGIIIYLFGLLILPGYSISHVVVKVNEAKRKQRQLKDAFPDDKTSLIKLLDTK